MKKMFFLLTAFLLFCNTVSFAGSVPEDMLVENNALIFFGEVVDCDLNGEEASIDVLPIKRIKGDIKTGYEREFLKPFPVRGIEVQVGNTYLFAYYDEINPTYIFETTSQDTKTLKLKNIDSDMWKRFEKLINDGSYEKSEEERCKVSLVDVVGITREKANKVRIEYDGKEYTVDKDKFFDIAENMTVIDIEDIYFSDIETKGIYIIISDDEEKGFGYAYISLDGYLDKYSMFMSRLPMGDYKAEKDDLEKICSLISVNVDTGETDAKSNSFPLKQIIISVIILAAVLTVIFIGRRKQK